MSAATATVMALTFSPVCQPPTPKPVTHRPRAAYRVSAPRRRVTSIKLTALAANPIPSMPLQQPPPDCAKQACLALTFDDGPDPHLTPKLLDILAEHQVKATFFVLGSQVARYPELARRIAEEGHEIGNHSWGHGNFTKMKPAQMLQDITHTQDMLQAAGVTPPTLFRPPYGASNEAVRRTVPLAFTFWNIDPRDWKQQKPTELTASIMAAAKPGGIVVLHDIKSTTVAAAPEFITNLKQRYHLVTVSRLKPVTQSAGHATR